MKLREVLSSMMPHCLDVSVFLLLLVGGALSGAEEEYINNIANSFPTMSWSQLLQTWHTDCHRRCNQQLYRHVEIACENDPYRIETQKKRTLPRLGYSKRDQDSPLLSRNAASLFLNKRSVPGILLQRNKRSQIMEECCFRKGCAWEEYGEYCHGHNRRRRDRISSCS